MLNERLATNHANFGLSLYRCAAILMVVGANAIYLLQWHLPFLAQLAPILGTLGLESFFVLAGFWLAQKLYPVFLHPDFGFRLAFAFVVRKLCRILPFYWLVLILNLLLARQMNYAVPDAWKYFVLLQNFAKPIPAFFPESWGIPVIVFSIIAFAVLLAAISVVTKARFKTLVFVGVAFFLALIFLWTKWLFNATHQNIDLADWDAKIKTVAIYRADSVFYGVLIGWLVQADQLRKFKWIFAASALFGLAFLTIGVGYFRLTIENHPLFWNVFYLPLTSIILAFLLPILTDWQSAPKFLTASVNLISKASYSIYLLHFSLVLLVFEHFLLADLPQFGVAKVAGLSAAYFFVAILFGLGFYFAVEKPLRKRLKC